MKLMMYCVLISIICMTGFRQGVSQHVKVCEVLLCDAARHMAWLSQLVTNSMKNPRWQGYPRKVLQSTVSEPWYNTDTLKAEILKAQSTLNADSFKAETPNSGVKTLCLEIVDCFLELLRRGIAHFAVQTPGGSDRVHRV